MASQNRSKNTVRNAPEVSFVIPVYNEKENVAILISDLLPALDRLKRTYEIIFVDDGSIDGTLQELQRLSVDTPMMKVIGFSRNFGKASAYMAGFEKATGDFLVTMDGDLQDDPADIHKLLAKLDEGYDFVSGWKWEGKGQITKSLPSKFFNVVTSFLTGIKLHDFNCPLKAYRKAVFKDLNIYEGQYRFIPVFVSRKGYTFGEVKVTNNPRRYGQSKYGSERYLKGLFDLLTIMFTTRYLSRPLHAFGKLGLLFLIAGLLLGFYLIGGHIIGYWLFDKTNWVMRERPLLTIGLLLIMMGIQFISIGLLGEMMAKMKMSLDPTPTYTISEVLGFDDSEK